MLSLLMTLQSTCMATRPISSSFSWPWRDFVMHLVPRLIEVRVHKDVRCVRSYKRERERVLADSHTTVC